MFVSPLAVVSKAECHYIFHKSSSRQFAGKPIAFTSTFG